MGPKRLLELIAIGIRNGNYDDTLGVIDEAIKQLPEDATFAQPVCQECGRNLPTEGHAIECTEYR